MEAATIGALAALFGLVIGRLWDNRLESRRWRRDQRIRVYEKFAAVHYEMREALRVLALTKPSTPEAAAAENRVRELGADWNKAMVAVWLHGSGPVTEAVRRLDEEVVRLVDIVRSRQLTWEEFREQRSAASRNLEAYVEAVRGELKLPRLDVAVTTLRGGTESLPRPAGARETPSTSNARKKRRT
jgi:hypothetical protein